MSGSTPRTLAEDLRSRSDVELSALFTARPDLLRPIPSDMRALTTRAATAPSIARYLDDVDAVHHHVLRVATELTTGGPARLDSIIETATGQLHESARDAVAAAAHRLWVAALLWGDDATTHVVTAVRDQVAHAPVPPWPSPAPTNEGTRSQADVDTAAGIQARSALSMLEEIADRWRREPGVVLRSGGLASRSLDVLVDAFDAPRPDVSCLLECARSARLFAVGPTGDDIGWMPTARFDEWCDMAPDRRWALLVDAWLDSPEMATDKAFEPQEHPFAIPWRRQLLEIVDSAPVPWDVESVITELDFRKPRRSGAKRSASIALLWQEAGTLGLIAHGQATSAGRAVVHDGDLRAIAHGIRPHLVSEIDRVHIQADHTIVAPGPLRPSVGRRLREIAEVESRGQATVFRLTTASIHRGLAVEADPAAWIDFLVVVGGREVPQPVAYAINDAARNAPAPASRFVAPPPPRMRTRSRVEASTASVEKAIRILRSQEVRQAITSSEVEIPKLESAAVVAQLRYSIDHNETVHLTHAESDGSVAILLVDPIRLGGGSLTAYDHHLEQVRTFAVSRINGVAVLQVSA